MYKFKEDQMCVPCYVWSGQNDIEDGAIQQMKNASSLPFAFHHTALMADGHVGYGIPIGGVVATKNVIVPFMVGVDIGCGMLSVKTNLTELSREDLISIIDKIKEKIPTGFAHHKNAQDESLLPIGWEETIIVKQEYNKARHQIGTLGGGNHFIEIQKDTNGVIWFMIHSGSRNLGKRVADNYNKIAIKLNQSWHSCVNPKHELAFLPIRSREAQLYFSEMNYCIAFALANRKLMANFIMNSFNEVIGSNINFEEPINIAHNYARWENHFGKNVIIHRKGATSAREGEVCIIPGSQGAKSYIVCGLGNPESFMSCSHGAGRKMSRTRAKKELSLEDEIVHMNSMGIIHDIRSIENLDEAPGAYKNIDIVMDCQKDLVEILVELTPIAVIKG